MSQVQPSVHGHFIAGFDTPQASGQTFEVLAPADSLVLGHAARGDARDAQIAVATATAAFAPWANLAPATRERIPLKGADAIEARRDQLIDLVIDESGSTISKARYEVDYSASLFRAAAGESRRVFGETLPHERPTRGSMVVREPVGVVLVISPFNAALALLAKMVAFPLAAGNTVIAKPSEETPLVALALARLLHEAGLPSGVSRTSTRSRRPPSPPREPSTTRVRSAWPTRGSSWKAKRPPDSAKLSRRGPRVLSWATCAMSGPHMAHSSTARPWSKWKRTWLPATWLRRMRSPKCRAARPVGVRRARLLLRVRRPGAAPRPREWTGKSGSFRLRSLDFVMEPEIAAEICLTTGYSTPSRSGRALLPASVQQNRAMFPDPEQMRRLKAFEDLGGAAALHDRLWTEVKSAR